MQPLAGTTTVWVILGIVGDFGSPGGGTALQNEIGKLSLAPGTATDDVCMLVISIRARTGCDVQLHRSKWYSWIEPAGAQLLAVDWPRELRTARSVSESDTQTRTTHNTGAPTFGLTVTSKA